MFIRNGHRKFILLTCFYLKSAFGCTSTTTQYKRSLDEVTIQFQASMVHSQDPALTVINQILFGDSTLFTIAYQNGAVIRELPCKGCTFTGNTATGDLSIRLDNIQTSQGGTYKHSVTEKSAKVKGCVLLYVLGEPRKPSITVNKEPFEGESVILTCSSISTTVPKDPNFRMMYNWKLDNKDPSDTRFTYSDTKNKLTISNIGRADANKQFTCTAKEDVGNAPTSTSSDSKEIKVYYKPDTGPLIQDFNNNALYYAIIDRSQNLTCTVTGGYPKPSLSWSCFSGSGQDSNSGQTVTKTWTWTASSNGTCKCTSTQMDSTDSVKLDVRILSPPTSPTFQLHSQTVQSSSNVTIIRDSTASVTCSSTSSPSPSYKWTYNGSSTQVSQQATLNPSQVTRDGRYYCNVRNTMTPSQGNPDTGRNTAFINIQRLFPPSKPELRYQNQSGTQLTGSFKVVKGDTFNMYCSSTGNPIPSYQWTGDGRNIRDQVITVSTITQDRSYMCKVTNTMNPTYQSSVTRSSSSTVSVSVLTPATNPKTTYHYSQSGSTSVTSALKVIKGKSCSISCTSTGKPTPTLSWSGPKISNTDTLTLSSVQDDGTYVCTASNYMNRTFGIKEPISTTSSLHVQVLYAPTVKPFRIDPIVEGSPLSVECKADPGYPTDTTFSWKRTLNKSTLTLWQEITGSSINGGQLDIQNINRTDAGTYKCTATNIMEPTAENQQTGADFQTFLLNVLYKTSISRFFEVNESETEVTRHENSTINFTCTVDSNPGSTISIVKDGSSIKLGNDTKQISYTNEKVSCDAAGIYSCVGYNQYNTDGNKPSKDLHLYVTCKPRLSPDENFNSQVRSAVGEQAILEIKIKAYPVPKKADFVWSKQNGDEWNPLTENENMKFNTYGLESSLMILSVQVSDFKRYKVNITNDYGSFHQEFILQPYGKPNPPENVEYMDGSIKQTSVVITWTPGFHGGLDQTFHILYKQQSDLNWQEVTKPDDGTDRMNTMLTNLKPGTTYVFQMFSNNAQGSSNKTAASTFTTIEKIDDSGVSGGLIGGVVGGAGGFIIVVVVFVVFLRRSNWKKGKSSRENNDRSPVYEEENDYGMRDNPMYESAGPREPNKAVEESPSSSAVEYSTVDKTLKTLISDNEYAVVVKPNKSKGKQAKPGKDKGKQGKKGKKGIQEGDIYENAPTNAVSTKGETIYENPEPTKPVKKKNVNKDGLIYADLAFNDKPKGQKKLVIHGLDSMTEYVEVDFTKKADPLPDSDDENIPPKQ